MTYALDANIIIHLMRSNPRVTERFYHALSTIDSVHIPPYADYEVRRGLRYANAIGKEKAYDFLSGNCIMGKMRRETWSLAADLYATTRQNHFTISDADLLIAAFCIIGGHTLVTNNTKDFANIQGLSLVDWT